MSTANPDRRPDPTDFLAVRSRISWAAIFAGAMVALTLYLLLTILGLALGLEAVARGTERGDIGSGAAIYTTIALLIAFFFGGWATTRLAVGESKLEAVLYGMILWGLLFVGMFTLLGQGVRAGFGGLVGVATGMYGDESGEVNIDQLATDLQEAGVPADQVQKVRSYYEDPKVDVSRAELVNVSRKAAWWSLVGIVTSMAAIILGALIGSGELPVPVPILGVKRTTVVTRS